jgi:DNA-binding beta-propeller fold protein YncE
VVYADDNAGLNGKIVVFVAARQIYDGTVTVFDAVTGEVLATKTVGASTIPKGV